MRQTADITDPEMNGIGPDIEDTFNPDAMATPTLGAIQGPNYAPYLTTAGGAYSATAALLAGNKSASYLNTNAAIAGEQARSENQAGAMQAELYRQHLEATLGKQAAAIGGSNVTTSGSALRALQNTAVLGNQDMAQIQLNAAKKAWGYEITQAGDQQRAVQAKSAGQSSFIGGLITTGAKAYGSWSDD